MLVLIRSVHIDRWVGEILTLGEAVFIFVLIPNESDNQLSSVFVREPNLNLQLFPFKSY